MISSAPLPANLRHWVTHHLGNLTTVEDVSWPRENSLVWRVSSAEKDAYVKISPNLGDFTREVHAYHHATTSLRSDEAPRLLASNPDIRAIMTSPLQGVIVKDFPIPADQELRVHTLAGRLLKQWHAHNPAETSESAREETIAAVTTRANDALTHLEHVGHLLTEPQRTLGEQACHELPQLATSLPLVFRHGDFAPRNWIWNHDRGTLALFDFEKSSVGIAVEDFVWLFATTWPTHSHLKEACLTGYGRDFRAAENRALTLFTALAALSYLNAGITLQDPGLIAKARGAFGHLRTGAI